MGNLNKTCARDFITCACAFVHGSWIFMEFGGNNYLVSLSLKFHKNWCRNARVRVVKARTRDKTYARASRSGCISTFPGGGGGGGGGICLTLQVCSVFIYLFCF